MILATPRCIMQQLCVESTCDNLFFLFDRRGHVIINRDFVIKCCYTEQKKTFLSDCDGVEDIEVWTMG